MSDFDEYMVSDSKADCAGEILVSINGLDHSITKKAAKGLASAIQDQLGDQR